MAKEKFVRTEPHVNVGTIGHADHPSQSDDSGIVQPGPSDFQLSQRRLLLGGLGFIILAVVIAGGIFVLADQDQLPPNVEPPVDDEGVESTLPPPTASGHATNNVEYTLTIIDNLPPCFDDLIVASMEVCLLNNGDQPFDVDGLHIEPGGESCTQADTGVASDSPFDNIEVVEPIWVWAKTDVEVAGVATVPKDLAVNLDLGNSSAAIGGEVTIPVVWHVAKQSSNGDNPSSLLFNIRVVDASGHNAFISVEPDMNPDGTYVIGPLLGVFENSGDSDQPLVLGNLSDGDFDPPGKLLIMLLLTPSTQVFPSGDVPLCESVSLPPDSTEEPTEEPDSSIPASTEEPVDEPPAVCGDLVCQTSTENSDICPDDCPCVDDGVCREGEGANCQDCGASAGTCGTTCADSSQCAEGLSCAGGVCWDAVVCGGADPGGSGSGGGEECTIVRRAPNPVNPNCPFYYDSCGGVTEICN